MDLSEVSDVASNESTKVMQWSASKDTSIKGDKVPKSFLQLKGITVGNVNMGCNFHISATLRIMFQ